jgi:hypothetical protein
MAEALAVVPLVLAVYATIDLLVKHTDLLASELESHHDLKTATQNLHAFRVEGAKSQLHQELDLAKQLRKNSNDEDVKANLDTSFQEIQLSIIQAEKLLEERGKLHGIGPKTRAKKNVKTEEVGVALKSLKAAKDLFTSITINTAMQISLPSLRLLLSDDFQVIRELNSSEFKGSLPKETLFVKGNVGSSSDRGLFLLEERRTAEVNVRGLAEILSRLASVRKQLGSSPQGVLNCIGYRRVDESKDDGRYHLIFTLPANLELDNSLQGLMQLCTSSPQAPKPSLNQRIALCHQLSNAVLEVHKLGLVHKNINSVNILLMNPKSNAKNPAGSAASHLPATAPSKASVGPQIVQDGQTPSMFLADWHLVRKAGNASSFQREKDWWKRLYQHPSRHLEDIEEKYNMYHDIYSFGVCMIEILLWESLLVKQEGQEPGPSSLLENAVPAGSVQSQAGSNLSTTRLASLDGKTVQAILVKIARTKLPSAAGTKLAGVVVSCLKCLEGSFGPISFSETSMLTNISNFMTTIQKDLWDIKLAL